MRAGAFASVVALSVASVACNGDHAAGTAGPSTPPVAASLGGVVVARVGDVSIDRALVLAVARAKKISAADAVSAVINDALLAHAAKKQGAENGSAVQLRTASALSRAMLAKLREQTLAAPFTDEELAAVVSNSWLSVEHPELRRVVHALVKKDVPNARTVASDLRTAVLAVKDPNPAKNEAAFVETAKSFKVPSGPAVHVEPLRIAEDGRLAEPGIVGAVEEPFTKGAFAIGEVLGTSDLVETTYGVHVIRLLEKTPPLSLPREQKIEKLRAELIANRVAPAQEQLLAPLRAATKIEFLANDELLALPR